jgi:Peptidase family M28
MIWGIENKDVRSRAGSTRRAFLSASAVTAVAAPLLSGTALAETDPALSRQAPDPALRAMLREIDPDRIKATILKLVSFGTRHTASSQTDPNRGIGAATDWVFGQMQSFAAASGGRMTVQKQTFVQPVSSTIPVPTTITNVIATLKGTASPERFYVITGHLDSRVTDVLNFTDDAPGADDDGSGVAVVLELVSRATRRPGSPSRGRTSTTSTRTSGWRTACSSATCRSSWTSATPRGWPR